MAIPAAFIDPYYELITDAAVAYLVDGATVPAGFEVKEFEGELSSAEEVARFISRLTTMPQLLVNVRAAEVPSTGADSVATMYRERISIEVLCCASNVRDIKEQKATAMGALGYCRKVLSGKPLSGDYIAKAYLQYEGWETVSNEEGLTVIAAKFYIESNTDAG